MVPVAGTGTVPGSTAGGAMSRDPSGSGGATSRISGSGGAAGKVGRVVELRGSNAAGAESDKPLRFSGLRFKGLSSPGADGRSTCAATSAGALHSASIAAINHRLANAAGKNECFMQTSFFRKTLPLCAN